MRTRSTQAVQTSIHSSQPATIIFDSARVIRLPCGMCGHPWSKRFRSETVVQGLEEEGRATILRGLKTTLLGVVRAMLSRHIPVLEGCAAVAAVASPLNDIEVEDQLRLLIGVASEADEFPVRATRHLWSPDAVAAQDRKAAEYAQRVENLVRNACARLEQYLKADLSR
jgi:hypothetical protein